MPKYSVQRKFNIILEKPAKHHQNGSQQNNTNNTFTSLKRCKNSKFIKQHNPYMQLEVY